MNAPDHCYYVVIPKTHLYYVGLMERHDIRKSVIFVSDDHFDRLRGVIIPIVVDHAVKLSSSQREYVRLHNERVEELKK